MRARSMHNRTRHLAPLALTAALLLTFWAPVAAQDLRNGSAGGGVHFQGYSFDDGLGVQSANLLLFPLAYEFSAGDRTRLDLYGAWARGQVEADGRRLSLDGPVDTRIRARFRALPWALVTVGVNLPTGNESHTDEEALVSSALATELLGFREAAWGMGSAVTTGVATAWSVGEWGVGLGGSYRVSGEFNPEAGSDLVYGPGNQLRLRAALDRNVGEASRLTLGATVQNFAEDEVDGRNLFQAGNRFRVDLGLNFRLGATTWTAYGANLWRDRGDLTLDLVDQDGAVVGDTVLTTGYQNVAAAGVNGNVPVTGTFRVRPMAELRVQNRELGQGSGWLVAAGGDLPLRLMGAYEVFPRAMIRVGAMESAEGEDRSVWGGDLGLTLRWRR